jgi:tetratricopeptide (TPR) repeat protein
MTTVYTSPLAATHPKTAGTHVFIIGVGEYRCLTGGERKKILANTMGLKQLSSPPVSAMALANWFLGRQRLVDTEIGFHNPNVPLATVEMLLSPRQPYARPDGSEVLVKTATNLNIAQGFKRWVERAAANDNNIAVFYFCGHGVMGHNAYLLPSDFGELHPSNEWSDAMDIEQTAKAVRRVVAGPIYFFLDACRRAVRDPLNPGATPPALMKVDFAKPVRNFSQLILWANGEGEAAFGLADKVSRFTQALIDALSGYEAEPAPNGMGYIVTGKILASSVSEILENGNKSLDPEYHQSSQQQLISSVPFHLETAQPDQIHTKIRSSWVVGAEVRQLLISCNLDVPKEAIERLAENLEAAQNLQVQALQNKIHNWKQENGKFRRDNEAEPDRKLAERVRELLDAGKLQEAGAAYEGLMKAAEARREAEDARIASYNFDRGRIFLLDFKPLEALPHLEKAYRLCPDDPEYALHYAGLLHEQRKYRSEEPVLVAAIRRLRELAVSTSGRHRDQLARALNNLGLLHTEEHRNAEARQAYTKALEIHSKLAQEIPAAYLPDVAGTLNNLGNLHLDEHNYVDARQAYTKALEIHSKLAQENPAAYLPDVARTLHNVGNLHVKEQNYAEAHQAYEKALKIHCELAQENPAAYQPEVAKMLTNLGNLHLDEHNYVDARQAYTKALEIHRGLVQANPASYLPDLATTLYNFATLHAKEAQQAYEEALKIHRDLVQASPAAYPPDVARTLNHLEIPHVEEHRYAEARQALKIQRELAEANPAAYLPNLAMTLINFAILLAKEARQAFEEALVISSELAQADPAAYEPDIATTQNRLGILHADERLYAEARQAFEEGRQVNEELSTPSTQGT